MLVVHGVWLRAGRLALWGEDSDLPSQQPRRRGREPKQRPHPFVADTTALSGAFGELAAKAAGGSVVLELPTIGGAPCASPELGLVDPPEGSDTTVSLAQWSVPTLEYEPDDALAVLGMEFPPEIVVGASVRHLCAIAEFVTDLVARGRVLPSVAVDAQGPVAVWRPLLSGADAGWARALTHGLPPVGRAEVPRAPRSARDFGAARDSGSAPETTPQAMPGYSAAETVVNTIDGLVDVAARATLGDLTLGGAVQGARAAVRVWLGGLTGRERRFAAGPAAVDELVNELASWQRDASGGAVRVCFRLVEPKQDELKPEVAAPESVGRDRSEFAALARMGVLGAEPNWRVEFALQAADDPSLIVDAERVWRSRGVLRALERHVRAPQETLLAELGRASRLCPELESALRTARPSALRLDAAGAHHFLRERAPMLAAAGFGVLLPSWWNSSSARLGVRLNARASATPTAPGTVAKRSGFGLEALADYRWDLALGDDSLTEEELLTLAGVKAPLVRLRGQWVELDPARLAAGLKLIKNSGQMSVVEVLRAGLGEQEGPGGLPIIGVHAEGPLGELLAGAADQRLDPVQAPDGFRGTLRPYQQRGLAWLAFLQSLGLGGVLADDMGLGKTVQLLALLTRDGEETGPTLLICPMSLVGNWEREAERFAPHLRVHVHHGAERPRGRYFAEAVRNSDLIITTYSLAARDAEALGRVDWHRLVVDEAQAIKNAATQQSSAVRSIPARHRIALTGTPVENRLADLWSIMEFANPGLLGTAARFKKRYAEPVERHGDEAAANRLRRITGPFVLRRLKTDTSIISDLPEKLEMEVLCNLTAEQASLYEAVVEDMLAKVERSDGIERRGLVLATMAKLKQVCNHPAQFLHDGTRLTGRSGKLARLEETLEEVLAAGEKALLFTQYAEFGGMLRSHLGARFGREVLFLHGGVAKADRDAMVERFQDERSKEPSLFVLSLKAGGTGLTLTAANHVVHVDRWWNPAVEDQATDRAFRIGQRRAVQVRKFVCVGTLEEKIASMITEKRGLAAKIVGTGEQWLTELSTEQLRELLALEDRAVVE